MQQALLLGRWNMWVPNSIAEWDAISGDPSVPSGWEVERLASMQRHLSYGDCVYDIGTEHGWLAAIIAREFVGPENMVLMEPSPEFWPNIRWTWKYNGFAPPAACWAGFVGAETSEGWRANDVVLDRPKWPAGSDGPETGAMAYRSLTSNYAGIPTITVDDMAARTRRPVALNIDVEGAELLVLQGAEGWIDSHQDIHIWVSIHPDLMENFGHTKDDLLVFMDREWWHHEHLATDHEEHHHFWMEIPF